MQLIFTAEIKGSVLMDERYVESTVKVLYKAFQLEDEPENYIVELVNA